MHGTERANDITRADQNKSEHTGKIADKDKVIDGSQTVFGSDIGEKSASVESNDTNTLIDDDEFTTSCDLFDAGYAPDQEDYNEEEGKQGE